MHGCPLWLRATVCVRNLLEGVSSCQRQLRVKQNSPYRNLSFHSSSRTTKTLGSFLQEKVREKEQDGRRGAEGHRPRFRHWPPQNLGGAAAPRQPAHSVGAAAEQAAACLGHAGFGASPDPPHRTRPHRGMGPRVTGSASSPQANVNLQGEENACVLRTRASTGLKRHRFTDSLTKEVPVLGVAWKLLHNPTFYAFLLNE